MEIQKRGKFSESEKEKRVDEKNNIVDTHGHNKEEEKYEIFIHFTEM